MKAYMYQMATEFESKAPCIS